MSSSNISQTTHFQSDLKPDFNSITYQSYKKNIENIKLSGHLTKLWVLPTFVENKVSLLGSRAFIKFPKKILRFHENQYISK